VICNGRDAVANESPEALQRRAKESAVCQLQLVVRRRFGRLSKPPSARSLSYLIVFLQYGERCSSD
jgi:hypothetical protein